MDTMLSDDVLSEEDKAFFDREGYLMLPGFLDEPTRERLKTDVAELMQDREAKEDRLLVAYTELGLLTSHPPMMQKLAAIMGSKFAMHHIHAVRQNPGFPGVHWHQDYEQHPQTNRSHIMVHVFYYLDGLNGEVGDLLVLPGSQGVLVDRQGLRMFGTEDLPGSICVDDVPPGTAIIVHSGVWHARRQKPGGENHPRYFIDISYCQNGILWPGYGGNHHAEINRTALETGCGRDGDYDFLYDSSQFYAPKTVMAKFREANQGSLVLQLKGTPDEQ